MNDEGNKRTQTESSDCCVDDRDVPEPSRIRRPIQNDSRLNRFLLDYNWNFLPWVGVILWALFLAFR
jgi:hypothetical protein